MVVRRPARNVERLIWRSPKEKRKRQRAAAWHSSSKLPKLWPNFGWLPLASALAPVGENLFSSLDNCVLTHVSKQADD